MAARSPMKVPSFMLKKLYVSASLRNETGGVSFQLRNTLATTTLTAPPLIRINGDDIPAEHVTVHVDGETLADDGYAEGVTLGKNAEVKVLAHGRQLDPGAHVIEVEAESREWQTLAIRIEENL